MQRETTTTPKAIDLGLPSGTLWADRNLGAESATDYGDYYMWGSTEPDTDKPCNWERTTFNGGFRWCNPDMMEVFKKKAFPNGNLSDQYDAAHVQLGCDWHIPTYELFHELLEYTDSEWISLEGINGRNFISKVNGNYIFIPASGIRNGSSDYDAGRCSILWSSTLYSCDPNDTYRLYFTSGTIYVGSGNYSRVGFSIRPVRNR